MQNKIDEDIESYDIGITPMWKVVFMVICIFMACVGFMGAVLFGSSILVDSIVSGLVAK